MESPENFVPRFSLMEELHRMVIKNIPAKFSLFSRVHLLSSYTQHVPIFYTLLTPLFQLIYASNNLHAGYFETGEESWPEAQHNTTRLLGTTLGLESSHRVLEVGSGIGGPAVITAKTFGCHVTGLNITPAHIRRAEKHVRYNDLEHLVAFQRGNALQMPFRQPLFDHAYAIESVSHMPDKAKVIREVARVTRPGARFGIIDGCAEDIDGLKRHPDFHLFNVTWGVRAEEYALTSEIPRGFERAGFTPILERDLTPSIKASTRVQADFARKREKLIVDLYGHEVLNLTIRALELAGEYLDQGLFSYKMWVGEKR